jgi:transcriptional regulator with GAF, ATPase, and Fis domain
MRPFMAPTREVDRTTQEADEQAASAEALVVPVLVLLWSRGEPRRVGELACLPRAVHNGVRFTLGRADEPGDDGALPLTLQRLRPTGRVITGPLHDARVSRWHLRVQALPDGRLAVERIGRGVLRVDGHAVDHAIVGPGALIEAVDLFTLLFTTRPASWPRTNQPDRFGFAAADASGMVGESPAAWRLRDELSLIAGLGDHVLVHGPGGSGKELAAFALHADSPRATGPRISRNAATLSGALVDVELFGNLQDCPIPGTPARAGLLAEADGGTLLLDFVDEVAPTLHTRLLRAMDTGEYQPVGDARSRRCDVRWFAAGTRDPAELPHALASRFLHHVRVPGLGERPEDIPLIASHLLRRIGATSPDLRARLFADDEPRLAAELVAALVRHPYTSHVRELHGLLWRAISASTGDTLVAPQGLAQPPAPAVAEPPSAAMPTHDQVVAALVACNGVREQAWRILGLRNRDQLKRLLKKYAIA